MKKLITMEINKRKAIKFIPRIIVAVLVNTYSLIFLIFGRPPIVIIDAKPVFTFAKEFDSYGYEIPCDITEKDFYKLGYMKNAEKMSINIQISITKN